MKTDLITKKQELLATDSNEEMVKHASTNLPPAATKQAALVEELMEIKKEREATSAEHRVLFLNVGMALSILLVTLAINWQFSGDQDLVDLGQVVDQAEEIIEIPISEQPPPPPPSKAPEVYVIKEVANEEIIEEIEVKLDVEIAANEASEQFEYVPVEVEEEVVEEVFTIVETAPEPVGGYEAFHKFIAESLTYPRSAARMNISGKVFVQFVVEKDGSLTDIVVVKGIGAGCDEEALRVVSLAPKWNPGKQRGTPVRVAKVIPIRFVLHTQ